MGRVGLIAGAVALVLLAIGVFFWSDIRKSMGLLTPEEKLVAELSNVAGAGFAITFAQSDAAKWHIAAGHRLEKFGFDSGDAVFARLVSSVPLDKASFEWPTQGLSVDLPVDFNVKSSGKVIEIGIVARAVGSRANAVMNIVYATRQAGNSGWRPVNLTGQFEFKTLQYKVPVAEGGYTNPPVLVINADESGSGGGIEVLGVYIKIVGG